MIIKFFYIYYKFKNMFSNKIFLKIKLMNDILFHMPNALNSWCKWESKGCEIGREEEGKYFGSGFFG